MVASQLPIHVHDWKKVASARDSRSRQSGSIALGLSTVEREFLADVYLPDGRTVHQALQDGLSEMYKSGTLPPLLGPAR